MLPVSLGVAWLVLGPLALWLLVRGAWAGRTAAVVTLALLEGGTIAMTDLRPPPAPAHAARTHARPQTQAQAPPPTGAVLHRHRPTETVPNGQS